MKEVKTYAENILKAAKGYPEAASVLRTLFPEAFEDETVFCRIGQILKRDNYPNNFYALFKWNGEVRLLNVSCNKFWNQDRNLTVSQLRNEDSITVGEFKKLIGDQSMNFKIVS